MVKVTCHKKKEEKKKNSQQGMHQDQQFVDDWHYSLLFVYVRIFLDA
jgi:hypothetical protein